MFKLTDLLLLKGFDLRDNNTKIHLAIPVDKDDPLKIFFAGKFKEWQEEQNRNNFTREYLVSLIRKNQNDIWLFAGVYKVNGVKTGNSCPFLYNTTFLPNQDDLVGRIIVRFQRPQKSQQSYLCGETYLQTLDVVEILRKKLTIEAFPGFNSVIVDKKTLDIIVSNNVDSWKSALSSVGGIYLIVDIKTGKKYIGSAYGEGGIWQRWSEYSNTNHGGNQEIKKILLNKGIDYVNNFQYSILEIADTHTTHDKLLQREVYWKKVLMTRGKFGYNLN